MIDLYMWTTDNGYKARIVMEETGLAHTIHPVELGKKEQMSAEYRKISPGHKIPAIVDHDGPDGQTVTLCESGAILKYAAEKSGKLYPKDPLARIPVDQWLFYASATFTPHTQALTLFLFRLGEDVPPAKKHFAAQYRDMLAIFDTRLGESEYLGGGTFSIADIAAFPDVHQHGRLDVNLADYPNLKRWHDAVDARPAVTRALGPL
jgi:GST-like protein